MNELNIKGFNFVLSVYGFGFKIARAIYNKLIVPSLKILWKLSNLLPEEKEDANPDALEKIGNAVGRGICFVMDDVIFKSKELESEKWLKEHKEFE